MSELIIPPWISPETEDDEPLDEGSAVFAGAFSPGLIQRNSYGGLRTKLSRLHTVRQEEMDVLQSTLVDTDGRYNAVWSKLHRVKRGALAASELLTNGTFGSGTTGFSVSDGASLAISVMDRTMRIKRLTVVSNVTFDSPSLTVVNLAHYVARVFVRAGRGPLNYVIRAGTSVGAADLGTSATLTSAGLQTLRFIANGTVAAIGIQDLFSGKSVDDFCDIVYMSVTRCISVNGASQTGTSLIVDGISASLDSAILPGDWLTVGGELKRCVSPLHSNAAGGGLLLFKPRLFRSPLDDAPIVIVDPMGRFLVSNYKDRARFGTDAVVSYDLQLLYE